MVQRRQSPGRSPRQLVGLFETLRTLGVDLYLDQQGVDTTSPAGRALFRRVRVFRSPLQSLALAFPVSASCGQRRQNPPRPRRLRW